MNRKLILWTITVGLGGFLFGLDVAVISGAEQAIQQLWNLDKWTHGTAIAMALFGTTIGAAFGNIPANRIGRKKTLLWVGIVFLISSLGAALAQDVVTFMLFRLLGGLSIGASSVVAPVYISEIAPAKHRGKMVISFQLNIVAGILAAYLCNYAFNDVAGGWRWMLGIVALPSLVFSILMLLVPETPRWLLLYKKDEAAARQVLQLTESDVEPLMVNIRQSATAVKENLFSGKYNRLLLLAFLIAFFNQLSGINAIIYYAKRVFELAGFGSDSATLASAGIGAVNLVFTIAGWYLIDRLGRKTLMYIGSVGYIVSLSLIALAFYNDQTAAMHWFVFLFIASHAIGQGAVIWVFLSEIFPNPVRAAGTSFGCLTHWVFAAIISQVFPFLAASVSPAYIFGFFAFMMVLQLIFVKKMMPETKGVALENMSDAKVLH
jgi:MFS transporter, SP family, arabinose:H+ symporter